MEDSLSTQLQTWLDAVEHVPHQVQTYVSVFRIVQHHYTETVDEIRKIVSESKNESKRNQLVQLVLRLQDLADRKLELTSAIKGTFENATDEIKLDFHELEQNDVQFFDLKKVEKSTEVTTSPKEKEFSPKQKPNPLKRQRKKREEKEKEIIKDKKKRKNRTEKSLSEKREVDQAQHHNEPTYCFCHQVSYGNMVCCDNNKCDVGWFHFSCVGITNKPKGKWYCPQCKPSKAGPGRGRKRKDSDRNSDTTS